MDRETRVTWTPSRRALAVAVLSLGVLAPFAGSPYALPKTVSASDLAGWIRSHRPGLRVVDVRTRAEFDDYHIPGAQHAALESLRVGDGDAVVLVADAAAIEQARQRFGRRVYVLDGGFDAWRNEVLHPKHPTAASRYFGGERRGGC